MSSDETEAKKVIVPRTAADIQRFKLEKLLKNPKKPVYIPEKPEEKLPRVFKPPEFVRNIWGSSAGAGSGDFHVYRGVRRREYARQKFLNEKSDKQNLDEEFLKSLHEHKAAAEERTAKKRAKRLKKKMKQKAKKMKPNGSSSNNKESCEEESDEDSDCENGFNDERELGPREEDASASQLPSSDDHQTNAFPGEDEDRRNDNSAGELKNEDDSNSCDKSCSSNSSS